MKTLPPAVIVKLLEFTMIAHHLHEDVGLEAFFDTEADLFWEDMAWRSTQTRMQCQKVS